MRDYTALTERLEHEISVEAERLDSVKRAIFLALAALAGTLIFVYRQLGVLETAAEILAVIAIGFGLFIGGLGILFIAALLSGNQGSPFKTARGVGPGWFTIPLLLALFPVQSWIPPFAHSEIFGLPTPRLLYWLTWYTLAFTIFGLASTTVMERVPIIRLTLLLRYIELEQTRTRWKDHLLAALMVGPMLFFMMLWSIISLNWMEDGIGGKPDTLGLLTAFSGAIALAIALGIFSFFTRQFEKYDVRRVQLLRGLKLALLRCNFSIDRPDRSLNEILLELPRLTREFRQFQRLFKVEAVLGEPFEGQMKFFLYKWGKFDEYVVKPLTHN